MNKFYEEKIVNGATYWRGIEGGVWQFKIPEARAEDQREIEIKHVSKMPFFCRKH
jgi:hypothetical protein